MFIRIDIILPVGLLLLLLTYPIFEILSDLLEWGRRVLSVCGTRCVCFTRFVLPCNIRPLFHAHTLDLATYPAILGLCCTNHRIKTMFVELVWCGEFKQRKRPCYPTRPFRKGGERDSMHFLCCLW